MLCVINQYVIILKQKIAIFAKVSWSIFVVFTRTYTNMTELIAYLSDNLGFNVKLATHNLRPNVMNSERFRKYKVDNLLVNGEQVMLVSPPANKEVTGKGLVSDFK